MSVKHKDLPNIREDRPEDETRRRFLATLGVFGASVLLGCNSDEPEQESVKEAIQAPSPEVHVERKFTLGTYTFDFDKEITDEEVRQTRSILEQAYPLLIQYIPMHPSAKGVVHVKLRQGKISAFGIADQEDVFELILPVDPETNIVYFDSLVHELGHGLKGRSNMGFGFVEEGITTAAARLVSEYAHLPDNKSNHHFQLSPTTKKNIGVDPDIILSPEHPLSQPRYKAAAEFWLELERMSPGLLRKVVEQCYRMAEHGADITLLSKTDIIALVREANEDACERAKTHPTLNYEKVQKVGMVIYAYFGKSGFEEGQLLISLQERHADSIEKAVVGKQITVTISDDNGKYINHDFIMGNMMQPGETASFRHATTGILESELRRTFGSRNRLHAKITCEGIVEEFSFTLD